MTAHEQALQLVLLKWMADRVKLGRDLVTAEVSDEWRPGTRIPAELPDGSPVASVTLTKGRTSPRVTDPDAFTAWVKANHPGEVVETVRKSYTDAVLAGVKAAGVPVDEQGEVIPGVGLVEGDPYPSVRLTADASERIAEAWRTGALSWAMVTELEP